MWTLVLYVLGGEGCFIMPERIAKTDAFTMVTEYIGSGPYSFLRDEWVSGASAAYARNAGYVPRPEAPSMWAGGKVAYFDRVEWKIMPDPATASAALQRGEIDWWENPLSDLVPQLRKAPGIKTEVLDPLGALGVVRFNHLHPPFDNVKLRRALIPGIDQNECLLACYGDLAGELGRTGAGFFTAGSPYANDAGMEALNGKRDMALVRKLVAESGYKGEEVLLMSPTDQPLLQATCQVVADYFKKAGLNVAYTSMDWGTLVARRAKKEPPAQGGWNVFCSVINYVLLTSYKLPNKIIIILFVICLLIPEKSSATGGNFLFNACTGENFDAGRDLGAVHCVAYILGVLDAIEISPSAYVGFKNCRRSTVTVQQLRDSVVLYMRKNPQNRDSDAALIVLLAVAEAYPCKK